MNTIKEKLKNIKEKFNDQITYQLIFIAILLLIIGILIFKIVNKKTETIKEVSYTPLIESKEEEKLETVKVDVKGNVATPGVYELEANSRVIDAIEKAGGMLENSDTSLINLSKKLTDEMTIIVYTKEEIENYKQSHVQTEYVYIEVEKCPDKINDACINQNTEETTTKETTTKTEEQTNTSQETSLISINTATLEELTTLSGIGESKAKKIIEYRETTPFEKIEDIKNVSGIGESAFEKIKDYITV